MLNTNYQLRRLNLRRSVFLPRIFLFPQPNVRPFTFTPECASYMPFAAPRWPSTRKLDNSRPPLRREMHANFPYIRVSIHAGKSGEMRFLIARYRPLFRHVEFLGERVCTMLLVFRRELFRHWWLKNFTQRILISLRATKKRIIVLDLSACLCIFILKEIEVVSDGKKF